MKDYLKTMRSQGMQQQMQEYVGNKKDDQTKVLGDDALEIYGNQDAKKLAKTYKELSKDGLTKEEIQKLNDLDEALKGAEFHCLSTDVTIVTQHENNTETNFVVLGHGLQQNAGFINNKPGKNK